MDTQKWNWILEHDKGFRYRLLSRIQSDCDYYLGHGNRSTNHLWAENEQKHIEVMKFLWHSFSEKAKPEWLSWEQIIEYEASMVAK